MSNPFSKFENFGSIVNPTKRKELAQAIYEQLQTKSGKGIVLRSCQKISCTFAKRNVCTLNLI